MYLFSNQTVPQKKTICSPGLVFLNRIEVWVLAHEQEICCENTATKGSISAVFSQKNRFTGTVFLDPQWCCDQRRPGCTCMWKLRSFRTQRSFPQTITATGSLFIPSFSLTHTTATHPQGRKQIKEKSQAFFFFFYTHLPRPLSSGWALALLFTPR